MNKEEFIDEFKKVLETDEDIGQDTILEDIEEWDSLSKITTTVMFEKKLNKKITTDNLDSIKTVSELIKLAGIDE